MKKTKIIITICMVAVLMMTLCVSTFASGNVLQGEEGGETVDTTDIIGTWVFNDTISYTEDFVMILTFISNGTTFNYIEGSNMLFPNDTELNYITGGPEPASTTVYNGQFIDNAFKTIEITGYEYANNTFERDLAFLNDNATKIAPLVPGESTVGILDVANEIPSFLTTGLTTVTALFYTDGELTFLGYLAIASLAISVCFLVISIIRNFLHFRG